MTASKKLREKIDAERRISDALEAQLVGIRSEDDFSGGLKPLHEYPKFDSRALSEFELDLRDWGFVYGLAFGLAMRDNPALSRAEAARIALAPAKRVWVSWGGDIEDPVEKRDRAIRATVRQFTEADPCPGPDGSWTMTPELRDALVDLSEWARG